MNNDLDLGQFLTNLLDQTPEQRSEALKPLISALKSKGFLDDNGPEEVH